MAISPVVIGPVVGGAVVGGTVVGGAVVVGAVPDEPPNVRWVGPPLARWWHGAAHR